MHYETRYRVVKHKRDVPSVIESSISLEQLSMHYRKTDCACDPLARRYDKHGRCIVDYLFYVSKGFGRFEECPDPRSYVDSTDNPFVGTIEQEHPSHRHCLNERSGQIDEYEEEEALLI